MRLLVCGGRDYPESKRAYLYGRLDELHAATPVTLLITGACHLGGADLFAEEWAKKNEVTYVGVPAKFKTGGRRKLEGPLRNQRMLDEWKPDVLIAFDGGRGTADMVGRALQAGLGVIIAGTVALPTDST